LEDLKVTVTYHKGSSKFSKVIPEVYKKYGMSDKFSESDIVTKVVMWMIASMNTFGVVRPMFFQSSTENAFKVTPLCAAKQKHHQILYFVTWPMKIDNKYIYVLHNQNKVKTTSVKDLQRDLHSNDKSGKKVLKMIPDWIYKTIRK
jgi:hypothetical protein